MSLAWKTNQRVWITLAIVAFLGSAIALIVGGNVNELDQTSPRSNRLGRAPADVTLHFVSWKPDHPKAWDEAIARFEHLHPTIRVQREIAPHSSTAYHDLLSQKLKNRDTSMDLFFMDVIWTSEFAAAGWALPLGARFPSSERQRFFEATIEAGTYRGELYGIPSRIDSGMLYYRKDLLDQYGFAPPRTWDELVLQAHTIVAGERAHQPALRGYSGQFKQYEGLVCNMLEFLGSLHGASFDEARDPLLTLTTPDALTAVRFVRDQIVHTLATRAVLTYQEPESLAVFVQGQAVFHRNWPYAWGLANDPRHSKIVGKVGVAPLPHFAFGESVSALGGWLYGISAYSRHADEAWRFIDFMTSPEMQRYFAIHASLAPSRIALYRDAAVLQANPQYRELFPVFQTARPRPRTPVYPIVSHLLQRYFSRVLAFPRIDLREEAEEAQRMIDRFMELVPAQD